VTFLSDVHGTVSASEMTYIVSGGALNYTNSTQLSLTDWSTHTRLIVQYSSTQSTCFVVTRYRTGFIFSGQTKKLHC